MTAENRDPTVEYDTAGRMRYHPAYHHRHGRDWTQGEEKYLVENYGALGPEAMSFALGRTIGVVMTRAYQLRKSGKMKPAELGSKKHKRMRQP